MRESIVAVPTVLLLAGACALSSGPALPLAPSECHTAAQVTGTWKSSALSQLGPARSTYVFGCDCIVDVRTRLLWTRLGGKFRYSVAGDTIVIEQKTRAEVRFAREGDTLLLTWPRGDGESLTLVQPSDCPNASK